MDGAYDPSRGELDIAMEQDELDTRFSMSVLSLDGATGARSWRGAYINPTKRDQAHPFSIVVDPRTCVAYLADERGGDPQNVAGSGLDGNHGSFVHAEVPALIVTLPCDGDVDNCTDRAWPDFLTASFDGSTEDRRWIDRYGGPGDDKVRGLVVLDDVVVTCGSTPVDERQRGVTCLGYAP